jgi:hypothetical protein
MNDKIPNSVKRTKNGADTYPVRVKVKIDFCKNDRVFPNNIHLACCKKALALPYAHLFCCLNNPLTLKGTSPRTLKSER